MTNKAVTDCITIGMHRYPVHLRRYKKNGKEYYSYRVRLTKDVDPITGRRTEEDVTAPTLQRLGSKLKERLLPYDHLLSNPMQETPFCDLVEQWFAAGTTSWEQSTQRSYRNLIDRYHLPLTRGLAISDVTPIFLQDLYQKLLLAGTSGDTVRRINSLFRNIFEFAVQRRYVFANPCTGLYVPKSVFRTQEALTLDQQRRLLAACCNHEDGPLIATLLASGMRISEALGLTWSNVDFGNKCLHVVATLEHIKTPQGWTFALRPYNKNRRHRTVYLSPTQMEWLRRQYSYRESCRKLAGEYWHEPVSDLVFCGSNGSPLAYNTVEKRFKRLMVAMGPDMTHVHLHTLRHTAASNFYHETKDILLTKEFLGHGDVRTTERYTHSRPEDLIQIARARDTMP